MNRFGRYLLDKRVIAGIVSIGIAISVTVLGELRLFWWLSIPALGMVALLFWDVVETTRQREECVLRLLLQVLFDQLEVPEEDDARCTLLVPVGRKEVVLKQKARYMPSGDKPSKSSMKISQGVAGKCYRMKQLCYMMIDDFTTTMIEDLGFLEEEARRFKQNRGMYVCIPITDNTNEVIGIISLDSNKRDTFTDEVMDKADKFVFYFAIVLGGRHHHGL